MSAQGGPARELPPTVVNAFAWDDETGYPFDASYWNVGVPASIASTLPFAQEVWDRRAKLDHAKRVLGVVTYGAAIGVAAVAFFRMIVLGAAMEEGLLVAIVAPIFLLGVSILAVGFVSEQIRLKELRNALRRANPYRESLLRRRGYDQEVQSMLDDLDSSRKKAEYTPVLEAQQFEAVRAIAAYAATLAPVGPVADRVATHARAERLVRQFVRSAGSVASTLRP